MNQKKTQVWAEALARQQDFFRGNLDSTRRGVVPRNPLAETPTPTSLAVSRLAARSERVTSLIQCQRIFERRPPTRTKARQLKKSYCGTPTTKMSLTPLVSPSTRLEALEEKATNRPSAEMSTSRV